MLCTQRLDILIIQDVCFHECFCWVLRRHGLYPCCKCWSLSLSLKVLVSERPEYAQVLAISVSCLRLAPQLEYYYYYCYCIMIGTSLRP